MHPKTTDEFFNTIKQREQQDFREECGYLRQCLLDLNLKAQIRAELGREVIISLEDETEGPHADETTPMTTERVAQLI